MIDRLDRPAPAAAPGTPVARGAAGRTLARGVGAGLLAGVLASCGGGVGNPLDNPPAVDNPATIGTGKLSFDFFQRCVNPILDKALQINRNGVVSTSTCSAAGCHDDNNGTGGALRLLPGAAPQSLPGDPAALRATAMYRNYYSALGAVIVGDPTASRLLAKPLVINTLHAGGKIFAGVDDLDARQIAYWIQNPLAAGVDEFSTTGPGAAACLVP